MTINILAIGDVVGQTGLAFLKEHLKPLQKLKGVSFTVVNGENANVVGITPAQADAILAAYDKIEALDESLIPADSLIREFIGGGSFSY